MGFQSLPDAAVTALCDLDEQILKAMHGKHLISQGLRVFEDMPHFRKNMPYNEQIIRI